MSSDTGSPPVKIEESVPSKPVSSTNMSSIWSRNIDAAVITSGKVAKSAIKAEPYWVDYGEGIALASPISMKPMDAVLED